VPNGESSSRLYRPKLISALAEGYDWRQFRADAASGLTVAILALPLSMAIAVASGVSPERGLYSAIIGGFIVSAMGGSRFQIGGPAGAFIVLVSITGARFGLEGLILAVLLSGVMLCLAGALRIGSLVRHVPHVVTVGFTAGIAAIILVSQISDLLGLEHLANEPAELVPKLVGLASHIRDANLIALLIGAGVIATVMVLKRLYPAAPGMLVAIVAATLAIQGLHLPAETVMARFGELPHGLPAPRLDLPSLDLLVAVLPSALAFTVLGAIESLLSAKVADRMTGRVHRSKMELVAQGVANLGAGLFGGLPVTGTIARTAANIRAGARTPVSGILHSAYLLLFLVAAAPLAGLIPLAALAGVLVVVAINMVEWSDLRTLLRNWRAAFVLLATFGFTIRVDLMAGIVAGCLLSFLLAPRGLGSRSPSPD
jgi:SulP family sulfate permease